MAILSLRLQASSVMECIVASLILLIAFALAMDLLTRVFTHETDVTEEIAIQMAVRRLHLEYARGKTVSGERVHTYGWGRVEIKVEKYTDKVWQLTLKAFPYSSGRVVTYKYLIKTKP